LILIELMVVGAAVYIWYRNKHRERRRSDRAD
jgi:hypothetical protein